MWRISASLGLLIAIGVAVAISGCSSYSPESRNNAPAKQATAGHADHREAGGSAMEKMKAELAKLSPEDAKAAERQHVCPVSDEMLGTMGPPLKFTVKGKDVWICCDGCEEKLLSDPEKYLAKLKKE